MPLPSFLSQGLNRGPPLLPSCPCSWSPAARVRTASAAAGAEGCATGACAASGTARLRSCGPGLPKRGPPIRDTRGARGSPCLDASAGGEAARGSAAVAPARGDTGSWDGRRGRCCCRFASERRPSVARTGAGGCDLAGSRSRGGLFPAGSANGGVGTFRAGMLAELVELLSVRSIVPPALSASSTTSPRNSSLSISQGWPKASGTVARSATSGTTTARRKSHETRDKYGGRTSSCRGHRSWISVRSRRVFTRVAWCGPVMVMPVAPGPKYVVSSWRPVKSCRMVTPALQTSTASVCALWHRRTSGAMYCNVPANEDGAEHNSAHHPKSAILRVPSPVQRRFSGLMSRCTMPKSCRSPRPLSSCPAQCLPSCSVKRPVVWHVANRKRSHTQSSKRMYTWSLSSATSQNRSTWRQLPASAQRRMASISASTCASMPRMAKFGRLMTFMANAWPEERSTTREIFAKAPPPRKGSSELSSKSSSQAEGRDLSGLGFAGRLQR
mmetsp:Transcript_88805/g.246700  ORF Transcript_88805/g.246700 Transcript_88805/m.246700 type:complete len:499 (-) Transcript_88805:187-1683(-)